jgi:hypothetical protein
MKVSPQYQARFISYFKNKVNTFAFLFHYNPRCKTMIKVYAMTQIHILLKSEKC